MLQEYSNADLQGYISPNEQIESRTDLHYLGGGSDKVYIVCVSKMTHTNDYRCFALYGRRGSRLTNSSQGIFQSELQANNKAVNVISQKMGKGYKKIGQTFIHSGIQPLNIQPAPSSQTKDVLTGQGIGLPKFQPGSLTKLDSVKNRKKIENFLTNDQVIIEPYDSTANHLTLFYFVVFDCRPSLKETGWHVFRCDDHSLAFVENEAPEDTIYEAKQRGTIFCAYRTHHDRLALFDIYQLGETGRNLSNEPWKARRAILTQVFSQLFPNRDPYDTSFFCHLNEYIYDDKEQHIQQYPGTYIVRNIDTTIKASTNVFTV